MVVLACHRALALEPHTDPVVQELRRFAWDVAHGMEAHAATLAPDEEPRYHNRLHTADVLLALSALLCAQQASASADGQRWSAALLAAAVAHDFAHPGGVNARPFHLETLSWESVAPLAKELPSWWQEQVRSLILGTDTQAVLGNHARVSGQAFVWDLPWCQVLLNEADILISATAEFGPAQSEALAIEWRRCAFPGHTTVATPAGRAAFLRSVRFSSPGAAALDMAAEVDQQLATLTHLS